MASADARPMVIFPAAQHHSTLAGTKVYSSVALEKAQMTKTTATVWRHSGTGNVQKTFD